ncbi:MAG: NAD-dependent epimerase/dehydratase family protein, partial [Rhizomicrobium sp.]
MPAFGGTGFVGLNIAAVLLGRGHAVTLFDRAGLPPDAKKEFAAHGDRLTAIEGDITDRQTVEEVITAGYEAIILGAAITAGPEREASDPETILRVNLLAQTPILIAARRFGVRRIINLSSAAAYGASAFRNVLLDEATPCDPASLYAITKFASEKVAARLAGLWQCKVISVRPSAVFGPWERTGRASAVLFAKEGVFVALVIDPLSHSPKNSSSARQCTRPASIAGLANASKLPTISNLPSTK